MIIERAAARKSMAVVLAIALFATAPVSAWSQVRSAAPVTGLGVAGSVGAVTSAPGESPRRSRSRTCRSRPRRSLPPSAR
ncbi:MAG: hypothetical protein M0D55_03975 [Elusimicrobiota bacterium]|nr:MAG: hypothetical protein M0D55_03975 [Elusimicrobiota bacterium]